MTVRWQQRRRSQKCDAAEPTNHSSYGLCRCVAWLHFWEITSRNSKGLTQKHELALTHGIVYLTGKVKRQSESRVEKTWMGPRAPRPPGLPSPHDIKNTTDLNLLYYTNKTRFSVVSSHVNIFSSVDVSVTP